MRIAHVKLLMKGLQLRKVPSDAPAQDMFTARPYLKMCLQAGGAVEPSPPLPSRRHGLLM